METNLISKDSKGKLRVAVINYEWNNENKAYIISRQTGTYNGKLVKAPELIISKGKVNRTLKEQVTLEFNSICKKYKDKGYKELEHPIYTYTEEELNQIVGSNITNQDGVPKPMLAKQADKVTNTKIFDKEWYASRKINGLRMLIYLGQDGELHAQGRGAATYDAGMYEILSHPKLVELFKENPTLILDGEGYKHGMSLQQLNSIARSQVTAVDYSILQFYLYDIVDTNLPFKSRLTILNQIKDALDLDFNPDRNFNNDELRIQYVPHIEISGWDNMKKLHNEYVSEGWEGLVIRDPDKPYKPNGRTNDMIKIKEYFDDTFKVVDYQLGLRGSEDMCFICEMEDGRIFKAMPLGSREVKEEYVQNFEEKYKNQFGDCKYFEYSDDQIPLQPKFLHFRYDYEI